jgi:hypothetical protein
LHLRPSIFTFLDRKIFLKGNYNSKEYFIFMYDHIP